LTVIPSAYVAMASQLSKDAGVAYRYGPDAPTYGTANTGPSLSQRTDTKLTSPAQDIPFWWQVGGPVSANAGAYSSNQANMIYAADNSTLNVGVTDLQVTSYMYNVMAQLPQLSWTRAILPGGGMDSVNVMAYKSAGIVSGDPVAIGRCEGRTGFCAESLVAFQNGVIATTGSNTATNLATTQLAPNKVPTSIAVTNNSEFALVTVWDTVALKGQVAVVALAGLCDQCDPTNPTAHTANGVNYKAWYQWWDEWQGVYPGLPNLGNIAFMKVLGYVDIPGMGAPTEIAVTTGLDQFNTLQLNGVFVGQSVSPLTTASNWQSFTSGGSNYGKYAKGGVAVVVSKSEQKAAFIDLKPLFSYINSVYFSSNVSSTTSFGQGATQWPYISNPSTQMPTVIKTVSLGARPTAVKTTIWGGTPRAWIATQEGTLHIFALDGFAPGNQVSTGNASTIAEVGTVTGIGRNPTSLATSKGEPSSWSGDPINQQVIVASRGDNKISWVRFASNGNSGSVVRTIQHNLLTDLVSVEDGDNFANTNNVLSVTDYAGKAIRNYRYGPVIFSDGGACPGPGGCPINGTVAEYGGALTVPGKPYRMSTANVP
jgi:hypothetical protein